MIASGITLVGIAILALPTSIFASGFAHVMNRDQKALEDEARETMADHIVTKAESDVFGAMAVDPETLDRELRAYLAATEAPPVG